MASRRFLQAASRLRVGARAASDDARIVERATRGQVEMRQFGIESLGGAGMHAPHVVRAAAAGRTHDADGCARRRRGAQGGLRGGGLNHRFDLHAIDVTPARWRGDIRECRGRCLPGGARVCSRTATLKYLGAAND